MPLQVGGGGGCVPNDPALSPIYHTGIVPSLCVPQERERSGWGEDYHLTSTHSWFGLLDYTVQLVKLACCVHEQSMNHTPSQLKFHL